MPAQPFRRRFYWNPLILLRDLWRVLRRVLQLGPLMRGELLPRPFVERIMLAVTAVNRCRYCSYVHAAEARRAGISAEEIEDLSRSQLGGCPPREVPALLYAQAWASRDGRADAAERARLAAEYGEADARAVELAMYAIRVGNLSGNTLDFVLWLFTLGRLDTERPLRV